MPKIWLQRDIYINVACFLTNIANNTKIVCHLNMLSHSEIIGASLGMRVFHHKTKHWKFKILVPLFLALHLALAVFLIYRSLS